MVEAVKADGEEFQLLQVGFLGLVVGLELLEVAEVAADSRRGEAVGRGQGAVRDAVQEAPVDLDPGGVVADGATLIHEKIVPRFQFLVFSKRIRERLAGKGAGGQKGWEEWH